MGKLFLGIVVGAIFLAVCGTVFQNKIILNASLASITFSDAIGLPETVSSPNPNQILLTSPTLKNISHRKDDDGHVAVTEADVELQSTFFSHGSTKSFDCAVNWIRIPKTASTSVHNIFMYPLLQSGNFTSSSVSANTCVMSVGGCAQFWKGIGSDIFEKGEKRREAENERVAQHSFGIFGSNATAESIGNLEGNCVQHLNVKKKINHRCFEYDGATGSLDYGPLVSNKAGKRINGTDQQDHNFSPAKIDFHPRISDHVGFNPALIGWILPTNLMVFSTFRDPLDRILSSFYHGIRYGANQPGKVNVCNNKYLATWNKNVTEARLLLAHNDEKKYVELLQYYLQSCRDATYNVYTQFLDPVTKNLSVALENLERYVIVGLQNDLTGTLKRWNNVTIRSCQGHRNIRAIKRRLSSAMKAHGMDKFNVRKSNSSASIVLSPRAEFGKMNNKTKQIINDYISEDIVLYKRAVELYEEQRQWAL